MAKKKGNGEGATTVSIKPPAMRPSVVESEVVVPLAWSLLLATSLALAATLAAVVLREVLDAGWAGWVAAATGGCVWVLVFAWRVTVCEADRRALLLYPMEVGLGRDLDGDGYVGEPQVPEAADESEVGGESDARLIYVQDHYRERRQRNARDFRFFLEGAYNGRGTTWRAWDDVPLPSGRRVTRPLWEMWTGRLMKAGLAKREYQTAPLELVGDYRGALVSLREVL